jgi:hypothetical protein
LSLFFSKTFLAFLSLPNRSQTTLPETPNPTAAPVANVETVDFLAGFIASGIP